MAWRDRGPKPERAGKRRGNRPPADAGPFDLAERFYCANRRRRIVHAKCLDSYLDATAFDRRRSLCWRCPDGRKNRERFANS